ncbi:MAG: exo-alpha-sialidase [Candidatus Latescibacteria bacterium]|jgi:sialidase-1|nr:exo-alpha-sialidase [Candidatus Latescibacterota bacterium]MBT4140625.1 exo-alpha-sialidase [Candidatus Latescibacterota bacterium]MBT5832395.1 exo-alpha-sialidase [Candidatus Latescibacterota bacterium]
MAVEILESKVIFKHEDRYVAWPMISKTKDGELLVVFSGDRDGHVCPFGKTFLMRSLDNGDSWQDPELVNDTPLDDRDAGLCVCLDGTLLVSWFTTWRNPKDETLTDAWREHLEGISDTDVKQWTQPNLTDSTLIERGHWIRRSTDNGKTWEEPIAVPGTAPHGPNVLSDGRLFFVGNEGYRRNDKSSALACAESKDMGKTWTVLARVSMFPDAAPSDAGGMRYLGEPHVVEVTPGHLLGMARHEEQPYVEGRPTGKLWQFDSFDGGHTWTEPKETPIVGKPPHLHRLPDGRIVVTYGYRQAPFGERACVSVDGGKTWDVDNEVILRDDAPNHDLGYPATVACDDGSLLSVYYQREHLEEKPCLMTTRWRV